MGISNLYNYNFFTLIRKKRSDVIFILTAPFDEDAKTGDGQYAASLEHQFNKEHGVRCLWLKELEGHYTRPQHNRLSTFPVNTVPSVDVLQGIANGRTRVSGYVCSPEDCLQALEQIKGTSSIRAPKVLLSPENQLLYLIFRDIHNVEHIVNYETAQQFIENIALQNSDDSVQNQRMVFSQDLLDQFSKPFVEEELIQCVNHLSGLSRVSKHAETDARYFYAALDTAKADPDRQAIIEQLIKKMKDYAGNEDALIDIHIRPPDTGAFIMPEDIKKIRRAGIRVNLTIHEYKQNYTRRHLQKLTHDLMREANTVLFFNIKDQKNACKAAASGNLDFEQLWKIDPYNLKHKTGLTVAAQLLTGEPPEVLEVISKPPNILTFGTIRSGKGFEESLAIAKLLKLKKHEYHFPTTPKVIIAGDPQSPELMHKLFLEKYGVSYTQYSSQKPFTFGTNQAKEILQYWKNAKAILEEMGADDNPYLEIHPWCDPDELKAIKARCKYVCRLDDMGMRNNGSAIISVLDVGIVYAKWGCVTDFIYTPNEEYGNAVDIGSKKYGKHNRSRKKNEDDNTVNQSKINMQGYEPSYKRAQTSRSALDLIKSIESRELDQKAHENNLSESMNFITVTNAQKLLKERFNLELSVKRLRKWVTATKTSPFVFWGSEDYLPATGPVETINPLPGLSNE